MKSLTKEISTYDLNIKALEECYHTWLVKDDKLFY